jgi:phage anti-repressor protein
MKNLAIAQGLKVMENGLVPIYENKDGDRLINAREMHTYLESGWKFTDWIQERIEKYGFLEGEDFFRISGKSTGGRPAIEYFINIDMAKELAMVENNEKGREVRKYFIACEKAYKASVTPEKREKLDAQKHRADAMLINAKARLSKELSAILNKYETRLSNVSVDAYLGEILYLATGSRLLPPKVERSYSAGDLAEEFGVSANRIGRISTKYDLRAEAHGYWILDTAPGGKQVQNFHYNEAGRQKMKECLMQDGYFSLDGSTPSVIDIDELADSEC